MRDYRPTDTIRLRFSTNNGTGVKTTPSAGTVVLYKDGSLTESSLGVTVTLGVDGKAGANLAVIDGATALLTPGSDYAALFEGTVDGVAVSKWIGEFSVMNQGTDVVNRSQLAAASASGGTLGGSYSRVKAGDMIQLLTGSSTDFAVLDTFNQGDGSFTLSEPWDTLPAVGDYCQVIALPRAEPIKPGDLDAATVTAIQSGLATEDAVNDVLTDTGAIGTMIGTVDGIVDSILADTANLKTRVPAALVNGRMDAALDDTGLEAGAITALVTGLFTEADAIEAGLNLRDALRLAVAVLIGLTNGIQSTTTEFKSGDLAGGAVAGSKVRITATRAADSDRLAVAVDLS